jgi:hypothetical protein
VQIGLSAWIIQDGNYKEFEVGREYRFALEFYPHEIVVDGDRHSEPRLSLISNAIYEAWGAVLFCSDSAWVVDFGVPAYQEGKATRMGKDRYFASGSHLHRSRSVLLFREPQVRSRNAHPVSAVVHTTYIA